MCCTVTAVSGAYLYGFASTVETLFHWCLQRVMVGGPAGRGEEVTRALCDSKLWMAHALFALLGGSFQVK